MHRYNETVENREVTEMILLLRVDSKLVRSAKNISAVNGADRVVAVDDAIASNPTLRDTEIMSAPITCKARVWGTEEAIDHLKKSVKNVYKTLVVAKDPKTFVRLLDEIEGLPKAVNFAKQPKPEFAEAIQQLKDRGVEVYVQDFLLDEKTPL